MRRGWIFAAILAAAPAQADETDAIKGALNRATACSFYSASAMLHRLSDDIAKVAEASFEACTYEWAVYVELFAIRKGTNDEAHRDVIGDVAREVYTDMIWNSDKERGTTSLAAYLYVKAFKLSRQAKAAIPQGMKTF